MGLSAHKKEAFISQLMISTHISYITNYCTPRLKEMPRPGLDKDNFFPSYLLFKTAAKNFTMQKAAN